MSRGTEKKPEAKAREVVTPGPEPSPAWEKMKSMPRRQRGQKPETPSWRSKTIPGKCTCGDRMLETGAKVNPWLVHGHAYWCSMFLTTCADCKEPRGMHKYDCPFWDRHPGLFPF